MNAATPGFAPVAGVPLLLAPNLAVVLAPNPSPMTYLGTNTYLLGNEDVIVIDPGPDDPVHLAALLAAINGRAVRAIVVTHAHLDHSPLARPLAQATGAQIYGFGGATAGRSAIMTQLAAIGLAGGGEGLDHGFAPDFIVRDDDLIAGVLGVVHTPGHIGNHICLRWGNAVFCGDHVMSWASSLVSPPDGDLTDFMASCHKLRALDAQIMYPGHGAPIDDPAGRIDWLITHRLAREAQILDQLANGPATVPALTRAIYTDTPAALFPAAERNVFAHLVDLTQRDIATASPHLAPTATFALARV